MSRIIAAQADIKPRLYCVGTITDVKEAKPTESQTYINQSFGITGEGASPNFNVMLLYRPEWLKPGFNPKTDLPDSKTQFVFGRNISKHGNVSILQGLTGQEEAAAELEDLLLSLPPDSDGDPTVEDISKVLNKFFEKTRTIGYVLKQKTSVTGDLDDKGKPVRVLENGYEIDNLFFPTADKLKALKKSAEKSDGKSRAMYE